MTRFEKIAISKPLSLALSGFVIPFAAPSSTTKLGVFGEDCLNAEGMSSAAAQFCEAAQETSGSEVAFFLVTFSWLNKKK